MKPFSEQPVIALGEIYRAARVSKTKGDHVVDSLENEGKISTETTPTKRRHVTPLHGAVVYDTLVNGE